MGACGKNVEKDESTWRISIAVDSGACDNVISPDDVPEQTVFESVGSKKGENFFSATGEPIPNLKNIKMPMVAKYSASVYHNKECGLHGDDFITVGNRKNVGWFKNKLEGRFEIKTKIIEQGEGEDREARVLNRIIRVIPECWEYEPDQRHADILIQAMNLSGAKGVKAPGEDEKNWEMSENDQAVDSKEETHFRALAARPNYLALDRMDLQYATKEVCRGMAAPTRGHIKKLRRLIRYLIEAPRVVTEYKFQGDVRGDGAVLRQ